MLSNFLTAAVSQLNEEQLNKLGKQTGTRINKPGSHLVTIKEAYQHSYEGTPNFNLVFVDAIGKTAEAHLTLSVALGNRKPGKYNVNGVPTEVSDPKTMIDNEKALGQLIELWELCGLDKATFGAGAVEETVIAFGEETTVLMFKPLVGKQLTIVTSSEVSVNKKAKGSDRKTYTNQKVSMSNLFNKDELSLFELSQGITEPKAINAAIKLTELPKEDFSDVGYGIKYGDENNADCRKELKIIAMSGKVPVTESVSSAADLIGDDSDEEF